MKLYIVTETNKETNLLLRSWVCFTKDQAAECLKKRYSIIWCSANARIFSDYCKKDNSLCLTPLSYLD